MYYLKPQECTATYYAIIRFRGGLMFVEFVGASHLRINILQKTRKYGYKVIIDAQKIYQTFLSTKKIKKNLITFNSYSIKDMIKNHNQNNIFLQRQMFKTHLEKISVNY